jgi:hypothetical protein
MRSRTTTKKSKKNTKTIQGYFNSHLQNQIFIIFSIKFSSTMFGEPLSGQPFINDEFGFISWHQKSGISAHINGSCIVKWCESRGRSRRCCRDEHTPTSQLAIYVTQCAIRFLSSEL